MSRKWRIHNEEAVFFMSFAVVGWVDVFTRKEYRDIFIESLEYCQKNKGLRLFGWCLMSNHFHMICCADDGYEMSGILRDLKKFTSYREASTGRLKMQENIMVITRNISFGDKTICQ
jgi:REP element-mobilizing transposase RayT